MTNAKLPARLRGYAGDLPQRVHDDLRSAADYIEALIADRDALKHDIARHIQIATDLAQENEGMRKDAERYRWLRSEDAGEGPNPVIEELWNELRVKLCREDRMDREVDAAMRLTGAMKEGK